jgi:hypothetical protein
MMGLQMNPTNKGERIAQVFVGVLVLSGLLFLVLWFPSWTSISFAVFVVVMLAISIVRSRGVDEKEMMRRQDDAMGKGKDDPREMARWVP